MKISETQKKVIIGIVILAAAVGGYWWYTKDDKKVVTTTPTVTNPLAKYEGKNVYAVDANGAYAGGAVYLVKNGKKMWYGNNSFESGNGLNWDTYVAKNGDDGIGLSQSVIDSIPNA
jgi:hypothetical protein